VSKEVITRGNSMPAVTRTDCANYAQYGSINYLNHVTLTINWTSISASNCLSIWGYTGIGAFPTTLSYFKTIQVGTNTAPAAPGGISVSSPVSWGICGWKVASYSVGNADSYTWSGAASGTFYAITGPAVAENQNAYLCVACGSSAFYCGYLYIPNNTSCGSVRAGNQPTDLDQVANENQIMIAPNPAGNTLSIAVGSQQTRSVELLTISGQRIKNIIINGTGRQDIDVSRLARGVYLILIHQKNGIVHKQKVVLQ
jgi:Secretion system C-terminal sorting domain